MNDRSANPTHLARTAPFSAEMAPPSYSDPVVEAYKKDVDRTLLRENLKLSVEQRLRKAAFMHASVAGWRAAGKQLAPTGRKERA